MLPINQGQIRVKMKQQLFAFILVLSPTSVTEQWLSKYESQISITLELAGNANSGYHPNKNTRNDAVLFSVHHMGGTGHRYVTFLGMWTSSSGLKVG